MMTTTTTYTEEAPENEEVRINKMIDSMISRQKEIGTCRYFTLRSTHCLAKVAYDSFNILPCHSHHSIVFKRRCDKFADKTEEDWKERKEALIRLYKERLEKLNG